LSEGVKNGESYRRMTAQYGNKCMCQRKAYKGVCGMIKRLSLIKLHFKWVSVRK